jgi:hypothetical protein
MTRFRAIGSDCASFTAACLLRLIFPRHDTGSTAGASQQEGSRAMKRILPAVGIALAFSVAAGAQSTTTPTTTDQTTKPKSSMGSKDMSARTVTLSGCLREADTPNAFVLANVDMSKMTDASMSGHHETTPSTTATATPPTQTTPPSSTGTSGMAAGAPADAATTVVLIGGADLKDHVGHQIEVTGMMVPQGKDKKDKAAGTTGSAAGETPIDTTARPGEYGRDKGKTKHTLNVTTVRMVSASCSMQ